MDEGQTSRGGQCPHRDSLQGCGLATQGKARFKIRVRLAKFAVEIQAERFARDVTAHLSGQHLEALPTILVAPRHPHPSYNDGCEVLLLDAEPPGLSQRRCLGLVADGTFKRLRSFSVRPETFLNCPQTPLDVGGQL